MLQTLNKKLTKHVSAFQAALKAHSEHVKSRQLRVAKYGQGQEVQNTILNTTSEIQQNYAMFGNRTSTIGGSMQELRRRGGQQSSSTGSHTAEPTDTIHGNVASSNTSNRRGGLSSGQSGALRGPSTSNSNSNSNSNRNSNSNSTSTSNRNSLNDQVQMHHTRKKDMRLKNAEKVESTMLQVRLWSIAPLVLN